MKNTIDKSRFLLRMKMMNVASKVFNVMCERLGNEAVDKMYDSVYFDPLNNNVIIMANDNMTIGGNCGDGDWHGALLNIGITEGIAQWEMYIDKTCQLVDIGIGICNECPSSKWKL
eukprot:TRINITY_DN5784_c0_g1_i1.p1 TRINITY_DN5784_c0_g1~~TRINITY_DN5784_c0_g1_i1.p1  ORF type:complete len:116 (-),score=35.09 TRINITY_DN5784_c0_g1_i1:535-882(-)